MGFVLDNMGTFADRFGRTPLLAFGAFAVALVLGTLLVIMRISPAPPARLTGPVHVWCGDAPLRVARFAAIRRDFSRAFPTLLVIIFPALSIPAYFAGRNSRWYVVVGLVLYNSAVMAEIYRTGILCLDRGQREAAYAVGLPNGPAMWLVTLPQTVRRLIPLNLTPLITLFKDTTLGDVVSHSDAGRRAETLGALGPRVVVQAIPVAARGGGVVRPAPALAVALDQAGVS